MKKTNFIKAKSHYLLKKVIDNFKMKSNTQILNGNKIVEYLIKLMYFDEFFNN